MWPENKDSNWEAGLNAEGINAGVDLVELFSNLFEQGKYGDIPRGQAMRIFLAEQNLSGGEDSLNE